jgi:hypothetical protein
VAVKDDDKPARRPMRLPGLRFTESVNLAGEGEASSI